MNLPTVQNLYQVIESTWSPATTARHGPWTIRDGGGGKGRTSSRVTAVTDDGGAVQTDIPFAEVKCRALNQPPLFMIREGEGQLDGWLEARGYKVKDPVYLYAAPIDDLLGDVPPASCFQTFPPLASMIEIWAQGGIDSSRIAIMKRSNCAKVTLMGRVDDHPAGAAYIGANGDCAMIHCLEIVPEFRRKGLALYMMRAAARWAKDHGARWMTLVTTQDNTGANALYTSIGMQPVGQYHYRIHPED